MKVYPLNTKKTMICRRRLFRIPGLAAALAFAYLAVPVHELAAEPIVSVHAPTLKAGYDNLQAVLDEAMTSFTGDFGSFIDDTLDKPELMSGFNDAGMEALLVPAMLPEAGKPYVAIGTSASFASPGLSNSFLDNIGSLDARSDFDAGIGFQPLVARLAYPVDFLVPNLTLGATAGYLDAISDTIGIEAGYAGILAEYTVIRGSRGMIAWDGLNVGMGLNYARCRITATVRTGSISQPVEIDPDGSGPLAPFSETIVADPDVRAGIESTTLALNANASTGATFFRALSIFGGGGLAVGKTTSGIALDGSGTVNVTGYLSGLVQSPGTFSITGTAGERTSIALTGYIFAGLSFRVAIFEISLPVVFTPVDSVGTGVFLGVRL